MKIEKLSFVTGIMIAFLQSGISLAEDITFGFGKDKPPFVFSVDARGLEIDIAREALAYSNLGLKVRHFNNEALTGALVSGVVQAVATARTSNKKYCQVDDFIFFDNVAISLRERHLPIENTSDLKRYTTVAWQGAYNDLGETFYNLFAPEYRNNDFYFEHHSQASQVKMFWLERTDVLVIDKTIFNWYRKSLGSKYKTGREVNFHPFFQGKTHFPALFADQALCQKFREGLNQLKVSGRYEALFASYGPEPKTTLSAK